MTKQTKPMQIGLVCFAFKLLRSVQETRHRRNGSTYFFSEGSMAFPDRSDLPARTMLTSEGSVSRSTHVVADPRTQRLHTLTPIECERLNGFPDDWTVGMLERLRYLTMGNALVVPLAKAMGKRISVCAYPASLPLYVHCTIAQMQVRKDCIWAFFVFRHAQQVIRGHTIKLSQRFQLQMPLRTQVFEPFSQCQLDVHGRTCDVFCTVYHFRRFLSISVEFCSFCTRFPTLWIYGTVAIAVLSYDTLSKTPCGQYVGGKRRDLSPKQQKRTLSGTTLHEVHQLLHNSFLLAVVLVLALHPRLKLLPGAFPGSNHFAECLFGHGGGLPS